MLQVQIQEKNISSSLEKKIHLHKIKNIPLLICNVPINIIITVSTTLNQKIFSHPFVP